MPKIKKLTEDNMDAADVVFNEHIRQYGASGTENARRRALYAMYSIFTGIGKPAAEFDMALAEQKRASLAATDDKPDTHVDMGEGGTDAMFDDVDTTEEDFDEDEGDHDDDVHPADVEDDDEDTDDFDDTDDDFDPSDEEDEGSPVYAYPRDELEGMTVPALKFLAETDGIPNFQGMLKADLVNALALLELDEEEAGDDDLDEQGGNE
jgi:hypothetical protein